MPIGFFFIKEAISKDCNCVISSEARNLRLSRRTYEAP
jgi:hypothetical protein